jgi:hypothetical protein
MNTNGGGFSAFVSLVRAEYREMPGMSLTRVQMQRFWGFDAAACDAIVDALKGACVLRELRDGRVVAFESPG